MKNTQMIFVALFALLAAPSFGAETSPIRNLQGCFQVSYRFVDDGDHDEDFSGALYERVDFAQKDGTLAFQHYGIHDSHSMKHWREEWKETSPGTWKQTVIGPFEDLRYECEAPLQMNQWRCVTPKAPKPRRDRARKDYDYLNRENTLQFTAKGWVQAERNFKYRNDGTLVATEVGWNEYRRVDAKFCDYPEEGDSL